MTLEKTLDRLQSVVKRVRKVPTRFLVVQSMAKRDRYLLRLAKDLEAVAVEIRSLQGK